MPFLPQEQVLRQNTGRQAGVIRLVPEARSRYGGSITDARLDKPN